MTTTEMERSVFSRLLFCLLSLPLSLFTNFPLLPGSWMIECMMTVGVGLLAPPAGLRTYGVVGGGREGG